MNTLMTAMRRGYMTLVGAVLSLFLNVQVVEGQSQPTRQELGAPRTTFAQPFSNVAGLRALNDGRVLVADRIEQALWLVNLRTGSQEQIGREGEGPGEYGMPSGLFAVGGDTTYMMDGLTRRINVVLPNGTISSSTIPSRLPSGVPIFPRGADARGRIYFDLGGIMMPGMEEYAASGRAPLLRWTPGTETVDTVGFVHFPPMPGTARPGEVRVSIGGGAYQGRDGWDVTPDGRVGIVRHADYRVEWTAAGARPTVGAPVPFEPVRIGTAEKNAWADQMATQGLRIEMENGRRRVGRPPRPDIATIDWPEVMPPFVQQGVRVSPEGELWVERSAPARADQRTYDVFDAQGRLVRQVLFPTDRRLVGFGRGVLYAIRVDADDLQWLEVYAR
ncbi:MAG TPA: hypothetical protein VGA22_08115 [Gemmatimonadales bacterium]